MKTPAITFPTLAALAAVLVFNAGAAAAGEVAATTNAAGSKPAIARGMSAGTIRELIGEPQEIKRLDNDGVSAESWIYRRRIGSDVTQEAVLTEKVPVFVGPGYGDRNNTDLIDVPVLRLKRTTLTQVTALLMVDGTLSLAKQWVERDTVYEN